MSRRTSSCGPRPGSASASGDISHSNINAAFGILIGGSIDLTVHSATLLPRILKRKPSRRIEAHLDVGRAEHVAGLFRRLADRD
jgi:hypothetical protein